MAFISEAFDRHGVAVCHALVLFLTVAEQLASSRCQGPTLHTTTLEDTLVVQQTA